ncbi:endolytic transglycosylase MltG [Neobittarella massiliensis]|uniref:Endolytic murein transglycosylase n=1 Tax=Neobittarella massiliensis (ex Bilen et al. 2018) TaxID=2041842 RepID=A0A8J6IPC3_9FIRM|nr:endolytic transglycosylase MltG [Neobittarella massiliensis]MBC3516430.1 endolytic transglycosylase MltG [Neobittarella massiliensis]
MTSNLKTTSKGPKSRKKLLLIIAAVAAVLVLLAGGVGLWAAGEIGGWGGAGKQVTVTVAEGSSTGQIAQALKDKGVISSPTVFKIYSRLQGHDGSYQFGDHQVKKNAPYADIVKVLQQTTQDADTVSVTIPEGYNLAQIARRLQKAGICDENAFIEAINTADFGLKFQQHVADDPLKILKMEGYAFPDTYQFKKDADPTEVARVFLTHFDSQITDEMYARMDELGMSLDETIALASMIQSESFSNDDMLMVSSVFHNRLNNPDILSQLQSDVTILFLQFYDDFGITYSEQQSEAYNTYSAVGIPVGAICNPGQAAIHAALYPAESEYFYFVTDGNNNYYYAKTYEEHEKNVAEASKTWKK